MERSIVIIFDFIVLLQYRKKERCFIKENLKYYKFALVFFLFLILLLLF